MRNRPPGSNFQATSMAPCPSSHFSPHAITGPAHILSKCSNRARTRRLGLGNGLHNSATRRSIVPGFRSEVNTVFEAVPAQPPTILVSLINVSQLFSIFMVMGIQIGLIVRKRSQYTSTPTKTVSRQNVAADDPLLSMAEHQPLLLAWALACAVLARLFTPRCAPLPIPPCQQTTTCRFATGA